MSSAEAALTDRAAARGQGIETSGQPTKRILVGYGFWIFLLSDFIMFSAIFAAYAVLSAATAGGPSGAKLFHLDIAAIETACLLLSSFTCGLAAIAAGVHSQRWTQLGLLLTGLLGTAFLILEVREFHGMIVLAPGRSAARFYLHSSRWWAATASTSLPGCCGWAR